MTSYGGNTDDAIAKTTTAKEEAYEENTISLCTQSLPAAPPAARHRSRPLPASARGRAVSPGLHSLRHLSLN